MSSEELKPCPFCGGDVSFHKDEECDGCHFIQCGQCRAFFDFATGADPGNDCATVDALRAAIAPMWNTRANPTQQGEAVEVAQVVSYLSACADGYDPDAPHPGPPEPLMTVAQHQRILAASVPAGCKAVPVELLEQIAVELEHDNDRYFLGRELRALLASTGQEVE